MERGGYVQFKLHKNIGLVEAFLNGRGKFSRKGWGGGGGGVVKTNPKRMQMTLA